MLAELQKYDTPEMRPRLALAREICKGGYEAILHFDPARYQKARRILRHIKRDKAIMRAEVEVLRDMMEAQKSMARLFPDGNPAEPDIHELDALYEKQTSGRQEARALRGQIQALEQQRLLFYRSTKPYIKAQRLLADCENAGRLDEIFTPI